MIILKKMIGKMYNKEKKAARKEVDLFWLKK